MHGSSKPISSILHILDPDVAEWLKKNKPPVGVKWHQQLTENYGARKLVSRCYEIVGMSKTCTTLRELRDRVAEHYGKEAVQRSICRNDNRATRRPLRRKRRRQDMRSISMTNKRGRQLRRPHFVRRDSVLPSS